jgi:hypothetical protein
MQVKKFDHTFSSKNCMETKVLSAKTKIWASFHIPRQLHHLKTNEQTVRVQSEQIDKDKYPESKNRMKITSKITS